MSETTVDQVNETCEVGVETMAIEVVEESDVFELSTCTVECETVEVVEEIVPETGVPEESVVERLEDECVSSDLTMVDVATTVTPAMVNISSELEIERVEYSSEWSKEIRHESEVFETGKTEMLSTIVSSDETVQYRSIDIQLEEQKIHIVQNGYETFSVIIDSHNEFEICSDLSTLSVATSSLRDIAIQVNYRSKTIDFSQMFDVSSSDILDTESIVTSNVDFYAEYSDHSITEADDLEWAEVGLDLGLLPSAVSTQTIDDPSYIIQYLQSNRNSEIIRTIKEIIFDEKGHSNALCETDLDSSLLDFCFSVFGFDEISYRLRQLRFYVDEFQNTDQLFNRSVHTQSDKKEFMHAGFSSDFLADEDFIYHTSMTSQLDEISSHINIFEEDRELSIFTDIDDQIFDQNTIGETQTNITEFRTTGVQTLSSDKDHYSISTFAFFHEDSFSDSLFRESLMDTDEYFTETDFERGFFHRRNIEGKVICDDETQISYESRSCGVQISLESPDMLMISTTVDMLQEIPSSIERTEVIESIVSEQSSQWTFGQDSYYSEEHYIKVNSETQTRDKSYGSRGSQTIIPDVSEPYWQNILSTFESSFSLSSQEDKLVHPNVFGRLVSTQCTESQTGPIYLKECIINSDTSEWQTRDQTIRSRASQTIIPDISEPYWQNIISTFESSFSLSSQEENFVYPNVFGRLVSTQCTESQTGPIYLKECIINSDTSEWQTRDKSYGSRGSQTIIPDISEPYWQNILSTFESSSSFSSQEERFVYPNIFGRLVSTQCAESQTGPTHLKECIINSDTSEWYEVPETSEGFHHDISKQLSESTITRIEESFEEEFTEIQTRASTSFDDGYEIYSRVTESSQTDPFEEYKSVFEQDFNRPFRHIMKTNERKSNLTEIIDTSMPLNVSLKRVSNPRRKIKITDIDLAIQRGWIDLKRGLYCNPSSDETIPFEMAIKSNLIEVIEPRCPNDRRFGLYIEKNVTKVEKLRIKDVLNTETGDLYDEVLAREQGLLLENGSFYDKQAKKEILFDIALLHHHIEVHSDTEIINYFEDDKKYFKIISVTDTLNRESYDFYAAVERGLVNLKNSTFRDTEQKYDLNFDEAVQRMILQIETIHSINEFYFPHKHADNVIERERLFSSDSYSSKSK